MSDSEAANSPKVEPASNDGGPDLTLRALEARIRQQEILAQLGVSALQGATFEELLNETARLTAAGLHAEFCKVLEHVPSENRFLVRAGVGWKPGVVGVASVGADLDSPAGFALLTGKPVISNHLENEQRFRTPEVLRGHGVQRAMNVILQGDGRPFGVLEVDSRDSNDFEEHDLTFLQGAANILGMAIERERHVTMLKAALERDETLLKEMNHRVKNSLTIVSSMLSLQARDVGDETLAGHLTEASNRVSAIARAHERLTRQSDVRLMDIGRYIEALCQDLDASVAHCDVRVTAQQGIEIETSRAISSALIVAELITSAAKYAYPDHAPGKISIAVARQGSDHLTISLRHEGVASPEDQDFAKTKRLGLRLVAALAAQMKATIETRSLDPGAEFVLLIPFEPPK
jgi:two-component sensor histidine kinase